MTLAYPLTLAQFWDLLPISTVAMDCAPQLEMSGTGAGQQLTRELAPALWRGTVTLGNLTPAEAADALALLDLARQSGASFLATNLLRPYPAADPDAMILGPTAPTVQSIGATRRDMRITGLPARYVLTRGDLIGISWGASPVRYGIHRIVVGGIADPAGLTGWIEVAPALPAGLVSASAVALSRPAFKAMLVPGSVRAGTQRRGLVEGAAFDLIQTLR